MSGREGRAAEALQQIEREGHVRDLRRMAASLAARGYPALALQTSALAQRIELAK